MAEQVLITTLSAVDATPSINGSIRAKPNFVSKCLEIAGKMYKLAPIFTQIS